MSISSVFKSLGEHIHAALVAIFGQSALDNVEQQIKSIMADDVRVIFVDAINAAEALQVGGAAASGAQKRDAAFAQIKSDLTAKGISLGQSAINLGIELVVGLLKGKSASL